MKKLISVFLLVCLVVVGTGCGKKNSTTVSENGKIKLSVLAIGEPGDHEGEYLTTLLEEQFNVDLEARFMSSEEYYSKRTLLFASGSVPDVIYHLDPQYMKEDAEQGFLARVDENLVKEYMPEYVRYINEQEPRTWMYSFYDEDMYGIPNLYDVGQDPQLTLWRKDWLNAAGVDSVPETIEEMYAAFTAVANADLDGDGRKNTYCLSANMSSYNTGWFSDVFGAYGVLPCNWMMDGGKVIYGGTHKNMKTVLELLNKWYKEGLIHPDFITDNTSSINMKFQNGNLLMNFMQGKNIYKTEPTAVARITEKLNPGAELDFSAPVKGPNGDRGGFVFGLGGHIICFGAHVEKEPEKMQKVMEMIEYMNANEDFLLKMKIGEEGVHYKLKDEAAGLAGGIAFIPPYDDAAVREKEGISALTSLSGTWGYSMLPVRCDTFAKYRVAEEKRVFSQLEEPLSDYYKTDVFMKTDVVPTAEEYLSNIRSTQAEYVMKIIMGEYPVAKYDEFIEKFNTTLNGKTMTEEANKLLKTQQALISRMKQ